MFNVLREEIREMQAAQTRTPIVRSMIEGVASPFAANVLAEDTVGNFRPPTMAPYDGSTDPLYHIHQYRINMKMAGQTPSTMCQAFCLTLTGTAFEWFQRLKRGSIQSFEDLQEKFLTRFAASRVRRREKSYLLTIKQGHHETLQRYLNRFIEESNKVDEYDDSDAIFAFIDGLKTSSFLISLVRQRPTTMSELITRATQDISVDEYLDSRKANDRGSRRREDEQFDNDLRRKKNRATTVTVSDIRPLPSPRPLLAEKFQRNADFTPLKTTPDRILSLHRNMFTNPQPMYTDPSMRDKRKYCEFHKDHGHLTANCIQLRKQIEDLIQNGELKDFVLLMVANPDAAERRRATQTNKQQDRGKRPATDDHNRGAQRNAVNTPLNVVTTIFGGPETGDTAHERKNYARAATGEAHSHHINLTENKCPTTPYETICFTEEEALRVMHPHNDAIVVKAQVANNMVKRILIDNGSSADILFKTALERMDLGEIYSTPVKTPLFGFAGERVYTEGSISLPVTFGTDGEAQTTRLVNFLIVDRPSAHNIIIGRPTLNKLRAVTSTYHLLMKFPTPSGIGVMKGNQADSRMCYVQGSRSEKVDTTKKGDERIGAVYQIENDLPSHNGKAQMFEDLDPREEADTKK